MKRPTIYVFINKSLGMSSGKIAAQAAHAGAYSMARNELESNTEWLQAIHKTVIVLEARDEQHLRNIKDYLGQRDVESEFIIDEGINEVPHHSITALVTVMIDKNENADQLFSTFNLYKEDTVDYIKAFNNLFGFPKL